MWGPDSIALAHVSSQTGSSPRALQWPNFGLTGGPHQRELFAGWHVLAETINFFQRPLATPGDPWANLGHRSVTTGERINLWGVM